MASRQTVSYTVAAFEDKAERTWTVAWRGRREPAHTGTTQSGQTKDGFWHVWCLLLDS
jgi:hypothetical protein